MTQDERLGSMKISRLVLSVAIPSMLAQFVSVLYSIVDRIYVGNIPEVGAQSLAGVGVCGPVVTMLGAFAFLVGVGGTPLMGISLGEGNKLKAKKIVTNCFYLILLLSAVLTVAALLLKGPMLRLFGASRELYPYADSYFTIYVCGTVFALISSGMNQFIIAQGYSKEGMFSVMIGAVMNIIMDPVFIFVFDMGVQGAALATVISQMFSAFYVLWFLFGNRPAAKIEFSPVEPTLMGRVLKIGFTPFVIIAFDNIMIISMNALLQTHGGPVNGDRLITCNTIVQSFMLVLTMPLGGISGGTQGILSYNYGACKTDRVLRAQRYIMLLCVLYTAIMFVFARTGSTLFVRLFTSDPAMIDEACWAIRICTIAAIPLGIQYAIVDGFTGMGKVQYSLPLSAWRKLVYFAAIFILPNVFNAESVFYAEPISDVLGPVISIVVYLLSIKKIMNDRRSALGSYQKQ